MRSGCRTWPSPGRQHADARSTPVHRLHRDPTRTAVAPGSAVRRSWGSAVGAPRDHAPSTWRIGTRPALPVGTLHAHHSCQPGDQAGDDSRIRPVPMTNIGTGAVGGLSCLEG
ncbi:DUF2380 domain-containing protein [Micrococcus terreus]|uniref:DUF2380 domain-containing protein n=1 Tax=Micrococcus terreus TaxID=574650 RepID=UPI003F4CC9B3